jgi:hypothetical protein
LNKLKSKTIPLALGLTFLIRNKRDNQMKKLMFLMGLCGLLHVHAQLTNTVPTSGPVGIGTGSPLPGNQLTVNGNARILSSMTIDGMLLIDGNTIMQSLVRMPGLVDYAGEIANFELLVIDTFGNVTRGDAREIMTALMAGPPAELAYCSEMLIHNPQWFSGLYKLFSPCPDVKVGIGTSSPAYSLDVQGDAFAKKLVVGNDAGSDEAWMNVHGYNELYPLLKLGIKIGGLDEENRFLVRADGSVELTNVGSNAAITINNGTGHAIVVKGSSGDKIFQLEDNGLIRGRKMKLDLETWADYVFDPNYKLLSLEKTKEYITKNAHLPNVPNEKEIQTEGLDIGEMMRIQMEKIEELTLHLIEMNERIKSLEEENRSLKSTNN